MAEICTKIDFDSWLHTSSSKARCVVATCNLNQWALDFDGQLGAVIASIVKAKKQGATFRLGPELGYAATPAKATSKELDTYWYGRQSLAAILDSDVTDDILCDIGMPLIHDGVKYNCRVFVLNRKILFDSSKGILANDEYHERCFSSWKERHGQLYDHHLSGVLQNVTGQRESTHRDGCDSDEGNKDSGRSMRGIVGA